MLAVAAATLVSGGIQAYSQYQQGEQANAVAQYNAKVTEQEAIQGDLEARESIRRMRANARSQLGARRAEIASSGVAGYTGSPLALLGEEAGRLELAAQDEARAAELRRRRGFAEAVGTRLEGRAARSAGRLGAASTILASSAQAYGYYRDR